MIGNSLRFLLTFVFAMLLLFRGGGALLESFQARSWQTTEAVVTESTAGWVGHQRAMYKSVLRYELQVRYVYSVNGRAYTSLRVRFSPWGPNENFNPAISSILNKYPVGTQVHAHFDPIDPAHSVLEPAPPPADRIFLSAALALAINCVRTSHRGGQSRVKKSAARVIDCQSHISDGARTVAHVIGERESHGFRTFTCAAHFGCPKSPSGTIFRES